jgi:hypothetical protein
VARTGVGKQSADYADYADYTDFISILFGIRLGFGSWAHPPSDADARNAQTSTPVRVTVTIRIESA